MTDNHSSFTPQAHVGPFITPSALMLDIRLTPVERNAWQVLRMLHGVDGRSALASLAQLRPYLTTTPLGQRAGFETAWRALIVLRLTGWISLVGQHRDPLSGNVLSELYQTYESPLTFTQACEIDLGLAKLLQDSIGHENNQVDRVALHIRDGLEPIAAAPASDAQVGRDDEDPPSSPPPSIDSACESSVAQQNEADRLAMQCHSPTYKEDKYKKYVRTARTHAREPAPTRERESGAPLPLPPCLERAAEDQRRDMQTALRRLPRQVPTQRGQLGVCSGLPGASVVGVNGGRAGRSGAQPQASTERVSTRRSAPLTPMQRPQPYGGGAGRFSPCTHALRRERSSKRQHLLVKAAGADTPDCRARSRESRESHQHRGWFCCVAACSSLITRPPLRC
ncbi:STY4528 family pathogenicity island replication protein [Burkholderia sp. FERM BP-3421]|uniref:STY4528 family pathogenicity island replication protein n=1 Tax=Burkholderia sp. FERM BP-3421 TaxID=1494466 RepID=UPI00235DFC21|nr:STY4528 family pathogenicity island replication protein [Burkholderia sp. FERM BP-3421]WDD95746.1 STY4528 family pathogenicity island replication protein [Burkholderia sp. FERM BP-3421]